MEGAVRDEPMKAPFAVRAINKRDVRELLKRFSDSSTRTALIFIDRHDATPPE
jgi:hypothetical protein